MQESSYATLQPLGFTERLEESFAEHARRGLVPARVARVDRKWMTALGPLGPVAARVPGRLTKGDPSGAPVVGDWVGLSIPESGEALVEVVMPRAGEFVRRDPGRATRPQVLAANVDVVFVVHAASNEPNLNRIERELAAAWDSKATPVLVLTKADLVEDPTLVAATAARAAVGVDVVVTSGLTGFGVEQVEAYAEGHRTLAMLGPSGVGKSTLINRLVGEDVMPVREVRATDGKGKHTTVVRELVPLPGGGVVIDTPGLRAVGLWDAGEGLEQAFPDIAELAYECRFRDCTHADEPGCAVGAAVEAGELDGRRLENYRALAEELAHLAAAQDARARQEKKCQAKELSRSARRFYRDRG